MQIIVYDAQAVSSYKLNTFICLPNDLFLFLILIDLCIVHAKILKSQFTQMAVGGGEWKYELTCIF